MRNKNKVGYPRYEFNVGALQACVDVQASLAVHFRRYPIASKLSWFNSCETTLTDLKHQLTQGQILQCSRTTREISSRKKYSDWSKARKLNRQLRHWLGASPLSVQHFSLEEWSSKSKITLHRDARRKSVPSRHVREELQCQLLQAPPVLSSNNVTTIEFHRGQNPFKLSWTTAQHATYER